MNAKEFEALVGRAPENDDLDRANCDTTGEPGHRQCGICHLCGQPRFLCGGTMGHQMREAPVPEIFGGVDAPAFQLQYLYDEVKFTLVDHFYEGEMELYKVIWDHMLEHTLGTVKDEPHRIGTVQSILKLLYERVATGELRRWGTDNWYFKEEP